jgi:hypothetical protein
MKFVVRIRIDDGVRGAMYMGREQGTYVLAEAERFDKRSAAWAEVERSTWANDETVRVLPLQTLQKLSRTDRAVARRIRELAVEYRDPNLDHPAWCERVCAVVRGYATSLDAERTKVQARCPHYWGDARANRCVRVVGHEGEHLYERQLIPGVE